MPRKPVDDEDDYEDVAEFDEDELEQEWSEDWEEDYPELDDFDDLQDWLDHEESWDEDKYGEA